MTMTCNPFPTFNSQQLEASLDERADFKNVAVVFAVTFDGKAMVFASDAAATIDRADFPVKATAIKNLASFAAVAFTQNPDAVMIDPNGVPYIVRK